MQPLKENNKTMQGANTNKETKQTNDATPPTKNCLFVYHRFDFRPFRPLREKMFLCIYFQFPIFNVLHSILVPFSPKAPASISNTQYQISIQ